MKYCTNWMGVPGALLCLSLAGCGLFASAPEPEAPRRALSPVESFMTIRVPGTMGTVSDPAFGENLRIVLEQEFASASGETCRRASLFSPRGEAEVVVMCRDASGVWTMAPRVWGQGLPASAPTPAADPAPALIPAPVPEKTEL